MATRRAVRTASLALCAALGAAAVAGCGDGEDFGYPSSPPLPDGATNVTNDNGNGNDKVSDDAPRVRGRQLSFHPGSDTQDDLVAFYRNHYPASAGWLPGTLDPDTGELLCLVSHADERYDEYVNLYPYVSLPPSDLFSTYLVGVVRLQATTEHRQRTVNRCGVGVAFPQNL